MKARRVFAIIAFVGGIGAVFAGCEAAPSTASAAFAGTWVGEGVDATIVLDRERWTVEVSGPDAGMLVPERCEVPMWNPGVHTDDDGDYVSYSVETKPAPGVAAGQTTGYSGHIYFIGTPEEPRISVPSFSVEGAVYEFVPAGG